MPKYNGISNNAWNKFIDLGHVDDKIVNIISLMVIEGIKLTEREMAIFCSKTAEINETIRKMKTFKK